MEIKTKYNVNDYVYIIHNNKIIHKKISHIDIYVKEALNKKIIPLIEYTIDFENSTGRLGDNYTTRLESEIYSSKQELIESLEE